MNGQQQHNECKNRTNAVRVEVPGKVQQINDSKAVPGPSRQEKRKSSLSLEGRNAKSKVAKTSRKGRGNPCNGTLKPPSDVALENQLEKDIEDNYTKDRKLGQGAFANVRA